MKPLGYSEFVEALASDRYKKYWLSPDLYAWPVGDHEPDAYRLRKKIYRHKEPFDPDDSWLDRHSSNLIGKGWLRLVADGNSLIFTSSKGATPTRVMLAFLEDAAVESNLNLVNDNGPRPKTLFYATSKDANTLVDHLLA